MRHPGIGPVPSTLWARSHNHWTTREIQHGCYVFKFKGFHSFSRWNASIHRYSETWEGYTAQVNPRSPLQKRKPRWRRRHRQASSPSLCAQMGVYRALSPAHVSALQPQCVRLTTGLTKRILSAVSPATEIQSLFAYYSATCNKETDQLSKADRELITWVISLANGYTQRGRPQCPVKGLLEESSAL